MNRRANGPSNPVSPRSGEPVVLITGGAGFVGANVADRLLREGRRVRVYDNLSRAGVERNLAWLQTEHGSRLEVEIGDIRDRARLTRAAQGAAMIYHFAAQVAVTTSLHDPVNDFEVNALGTLNVLEAARSLPTPPRVLFTSTNKVYGDLADLALAQQDSRYVPQDAGTQANGVDESRPLDFHSPYGCSKGAADQYVLDYARSYRLPAAVFRMSCIYGPHQFGTEDQGWVAHFLIRALDRLPITLYGDGMQVRDVLFVEDLVNAMLLAEQHMPTLAGQAFNIGGGAGNTTSLLELVQRIERLTGTDVSVQFEDWRTGDQPYYVSNTAKFRQATGWQPLVNVAEGVARLHGWLTDERRRAASRSTSERLAQTPQPTPATNRQPAALQAS